MIWLKRGFLLLVLILTANAVFAECNIYNKEGGIVSDSVLRERAKAFIDNEYPDASAEEKDVLVRDLIIRAKNEMQKEVISTQPSGIPFAGPLSVLPALKQLWNGIRWIGEKIGVVKKIEVKQEKPALVKEVASLDQVESIDDLDKLLDNLFKGKEKIKLDDKEFTRQEINNQIRDAIKNANPDYVTKAGSLRAKFKELIEKESKSAVDENLDLMTGDKKGNMLSLLEKESFGGSGGMYAQYTATGANFYFNPLTGKILYFQNIQFIPKEILDRYVWGIFRVALNTDKFGRPYRIVEFIDKGQMVDVAKVITDKARENIQKSIDLFNERHGFKIKEKQTETSERLNVKLLFGNIADLLSDDQIQDIYDSVVRASNPEKFEKEKNYLEDKYSIELTQGMPPQIMGGMNYEQLQKKQDPSRKQKDVKDAVEKAASANALFFNQALKLNLNDEKAVAEFVEKHKDLFARGEQELRNIWNSVVRQSSEKGRQKGLSSEQIISFEAIVNKRFEDLIGAVKQTVPTVLATEVIPVVKEKISLPTEYATDWPSLIGIIPGLTQKLEADFKRGVIVQKSPLSGREYEFFDPVSAGGTIFISKASKEEYNAFVQWRAQNYLPKISEQESIKSYEELKTFADKYGLRIIYDYTDKELKSTDEIIKSHGNAIKRIYQLMQILPESVLRSSSLKQINLGGEEGFSGAKASSYNEEIKEVQLLDYALNGPVRNLDGLLVHEIGHVIENDLTPNQKIKLKQLFSILRNNLFAFDYLRGKNPRTEYISSSFNEFMAESFMHYMLQGAQLRDHINDLMKTNPRAGVAYKNVYDFFKQKFNGREFGTPSEIQETKVEEITVEKRISQAKSTDELAAIFADYALKREKLVIDGKDVDAGDIAVRIKNNQPELITKSGGLRKKFLELQKAEQKIIEKPEIEEEYYKNIKNYDDLKNRIISIIVQEGNKDLAQKLLDNAPERIGLTNEQKAALNAFINPKKTVGFDYKAVAKKIDMNIVSRIRQLLRQAYEFSERGDFESAERSVKQAERLFNEIKKDLTDAEKSKATDIGKLLESISGTVYKTAGNIKSLKEEAESKRLVKEEAQELEISEEISKPTFVERITHPFKNLWNKSTCLALVKRPVDKF